MDEEFVKRLEEEQEIPLEEEQQEEPQEEEGETELAPLPELPDDFEYGDEQGLQDDEEGEEQLDEPEEFDQDHIDEELEEIEEMDEVHHTLKIPKDLEGTGEERFDMNDDFVS